MTHFEEEIAFEAYRESIDGHTGVTRYDLTFAEEDAIRAAFEAVEAWRHGKDDDEEEVH